MPSQCLFPRKVPGGPYPLPSFGPSLWEGPRRSLPHTFLRPFLKARCPKALPFKNGQDVYTACPSQAFPILIGQGVVTACLTLALTFKKALRVDSARCSWSGNHNYLPEDQYCPPSCFSYFWEDQSESHYYLFSQFLGFYRKMFFIGLYQPINCPKTFCLH